MTRPDNTARNAEIVRMRKAGAWPSQIARDLGISRNAVIGVLNRARLCDPDHNHTRSALRGEANAMAKLTEPQVIEVRRRLARGESQRFVAQLFGVSKSAVGLIGREKSWTHLTARQHGEDPGAIPAHAGEHVVSHTVAPTGADCAASKLNQIEDTAGASGFLLMGEGMRLADTKPEPVAHCVPRQGGGYLIATLKGRSGVSLEPIPEGARVLITDGKAERVR